jgi:hypothetical protein
VDPPCNVGGCGVEPFGTAPIILEMLVVDANATGDAVLQLDFDEARFRTHLLRLKAEALGLPRLAAAAAILGTALGPAGHATALDYGAGLLQLADELETIGLAL